MERYDRSTIKVTYYKTNYVEKLIDILDARCTPETCA